MKNFLLIGLSLLLISSLAMAGTTGKIAGVVVDAETGEPLIGANVLISARWIENEEVEMGLPIGASTSTDGDYFVLNIRPGFYNVEVTYVGYTKQVRTKVRVDVDRTTRIDFKLQSTTIAGEEVMVTAFRADRIEADVTATKQTYHIDVVETEIAGVNYIDDIIDLQADVIDNHFRGGRVGESVYLMEGATINNPLNNQRAYNPMAFALEQVEVLTSGFSAEYGNAQSGVVNMVMKEGGARWNTTFDISTNLPYYRTWVGNEGSSFYDPAALPWYGILADPSLEQWFEVDAAGTVQIEDYGNLLDDNSTPADSLYAAKLRSAEFFQFYQDAGRTDYKNRYDIQANFSTGGPISKNWRIFLAGRYEDEQHPLPLAQPNIARQFLSNVIYRPTTNDKIKLSYTFSRATDQTPQYGLLQQAAFVRRTQRTNFDMTDVNQFGLKWNHIYSPSTYMSLDFSYLNTWTKARTAYVDPDDYMHKTDNSYTAVIHFAHAGFTQVHQGPRGNQKAKTYHLEGQFTSQIDANNLINAGIQGFVYNLDVNLENNPIVPTIMEVIEFQTQPYEGALYIQDKMEWEGMIANLGLRWDFYNFNTDFYADIYSPLRNPDYDPDKPYLERGPYYDPDLASQETTGFYSRLQPRIGISFPVAVGSVIHLNYGTFTQRPNFEQIYFFRFLAVSDDIVFLGNPQLKPENTTAYDVGLVQALPFQIRLDLSAYYKDVKDLVEVAYYTDSNQNLYQTYQNLDYANIKGFHLSLEKSTGSMRAIVRYNFQRATGKASTPFEAPVYHYENIEGREFIDYPDPEDILMDYDRTHRLVANLSFNSSRDFGPKIFNTNPFGNLTLSGIYRYMSGRPYTWDELGLGLRYNKRTPGFEDLRLRINKRFRVGATNLMAYLEVFNALNQKEYAYSVFSRDDTKARWEASSKDDWTGPDRDEYIMLEDEWAPLLYREDLYLIANQPRHFRLGLRVNF